MLNTFPQLLVFGFYAPTIIRIAAALAFAFIVYVQWTRREEIAKIRLPVWGAAGAGLTWTTIALKAAVAVGLLLGYYTQLTALLGIVFSIKHFIYAKKYPRTVPLCRADYLFLIFMCLSLLLSGAGALAYDLPL